MASNVPASHGLFTQDHGDSLGMSLVEGQKKGGEREAATTTAPSQEMGAQQATAASSLSPGVQIRDRRQLQYTTTLQSTSSSKF
jgi:hypothetical protein